MYKCDVEIQPPNAFYVLLCFRLHYICALNACSSFGCSHKGEYPLKPQIKMENLIISAVLLYFSIVPGTTGSQHTLHSSCMSHPSGHECALLMLCLYKAMLFFCTGSVVLTQTHPTTPYVCRTGNITLWCQYDGVENVLGVVWAIGFQIATNTSTIPGHTALPHTTTHQELVVDSYTNLRERYVCAPGLANGSVVNGNMYEPQVEGEHN